MDHAADVLPMFYASRFICHMISTLLSAITTWIIHVISALGYPGVVLLMTLHSAAIPVPSEIVMPFAGFLASTGRFNLWAVALSGTLGNLFGATIIYWISHKGGRALIAKYEHVLFVSSGDVERVEKFFNKFGPAAIFIGRCIPIVATFISIPAGLARVRYWKFALFTVLGAVIWNIVLAYIGFKLGEHWMSLREKLHGFETLIAGIIIIGIVWWAWRHIRGRIQ